MTFDTGAQICLVPTELVKPEEFTRETSKCKGILSQQFWSEGKVAIVTLTVGSELFECRALALPGDEMDWTASLSVDISDSDKMLKIIDITKEKENRPEADIHHLPPHIINGHMQGAVLVSEGEVVGKEEQSIPVEQTVVHESEQKVAVEQAVVEEDDAAVTEQVLAEVVELPSVEAEAERDMQGGRAYSSMIDDTTVELIVSDTPRVKLADLTLEDPTLATA